LGYCPGIGLEQALASPAVDLGKVEFGARLAHLCLSNGHLRPGLRLLSFGLVYRRARPHGVGLGRIEGGFGSIDSDLRCKGIQAGENLTGLHSLVFLRQHLDYRSVEPGADEVNVARDVRVIGLGVDDGTVGEANEPT
jgi:hypothetical protein